MIAYPDSKRSERRLLGISGMGLLFDAMDVGILAFVVTALVQKWHISMSAVGLLGSINLAGMALGAIIAGSWADTFGRRKAFIVTLLIYSIASGLSAAATTLVVLAVFRFVVGFGLGGELPVATTFVLESSPDAIRARRVVFLESYWALGSLVAAIISYFLIPRFGWQFGFLIGALPALYVVILRRGLPETPVFHKQRQSISFVRRFLMIWGRLFRRRTFVLWVLWFAANFAYYGMFFWLPTVMFLKGFTLVKSFEFVLIITLAQLPGYMAAAWLVERWGRKATLVSFMFVSAVSSLLFGLSSNIVSLLTWGIILAFFNLGAWGATYAFSVEQYPSVIRGTGTGWAAGIGRIGGIVAPSITGWLLADHVTFEWIFGMFFAVALIASMVVFVLGKDRRTDDAYNAESG